MATATKFEKEELIGLLEGALNKTLGEIDVNNIFDKTIKNPKITGIAGDVIEQSLLGYPADNRQEPDLIVEGEFIELKTTGIKYSSQKEGIYEAKEPMSITAVSPENIINEDFENSKFWHKLEKLLFVYYLYDSKRTVSSSEYANFQFKGYQFYEFDENDRKILKNDWELVRNFIEDLQNNYENYEEEYYRISSELRSSLLFIDTAPKWPNRPRFRLKRKVMSAIVEEHFNGQLEQLPREYASYLAIDIKCNQIVEKYKGLTIFELMKVFDIENTKVNKSIGEQIVVRMFGGKSKKMNNIELFNKIGLIGKTITLTRDGLRTEDMKLFPINFVEFKNPELKFEDSEFYEYFATNQFLYILFEEPSSKSELIKNKFIDFRRLNFNDEFINKYVKKVWLEIQSLILNNKLVDVIQYTKEGIPKINKIGTIQSAPNFPKSKDNVIFVRGSGANSTKKSEEINGITMYKQYIWIKGNVISNLIKQENKQNFS